MTHEHAWKLLLVEDDADSAEALVALFELHGIETLWAVDGPAAIQALDSVQRLRHRPPDFVLLDVNLPNTNTVELGHHLQSHPNGCPVVLLSAASPQILAEKASEIGAIAALRKPFNMERLLAVLDDYGSLQEPNVNHRVEARH